MAPSRLTRTKPRPTQPQPAPAAAMDLDVLQSEDPIANPGIKTIVQHAKDGTTPPSILATENANTNTATPAPTGFNAPATPGTTFTPPAPAPSVADFHFELPRDATSGRKRPRTVAGSKRPFTGRPDSPTEDGSLPPTKSTPSEESLHEEVRRLGKANEHLTAQVQELSRLVANLSNTVMALSKALPASLAGKALVPPPPTPAPAAAHSALNQPSFAAIAATPAPAAPNRRPAATKPAPTKPAPPAAAPTPKRSRRVVIRPGTTIKAEPLTLRNTINTALEQAHAPQHLLVQSARINEKGNAVLTLVEGGTSAELTKLTSVVIQALSTFGVTSARIEPDQRWFKLLVHGVSIADFGKELGMQALKDEIDRFNPKVKLASLPRWLIPLARLPEGKLFTSAVIAVKTQEEQAAALKGIYINGKKQKVTSYFASRPSDQCTHCLKFGHAWQVCKGKAACKYCAGPHLSKDHHCATCGINGKSCPHTTARCSNCSGDHFATSKECSHHKRFQKPAAPAPTEDAMDSSQ